MALLREFGRRPAVQRALGRSFAAYIRLLHRTNRVVLEPADFHERLASFQPFIGAMWHGQHFMIPFLRRPQDPAACMVSRSRDGELIAQTIQSLGIRPIRGSGARGRDQRGGSGALREMMRALSSGENALMTADVPKIARRCGEGIVTLARLSGRPILPIAVVTSRRIAFRSWDRATVGLPFGRGAIVTGPLIPVPREADEGAREAARTEVERELNRVHARAYAMVGRTDPGAGLRSGEPSPAPS